MPTAPDHRRFALELLSEGGPGAVKPGAALLGAQGPDPFYFRGLLPWRPRLGIGRSRRFADFAHAARPAEFFGRLARAALDYPDRGTALAFVHGLALHYSLDAAFHPYVEARARLEFPGARPELLEAAHLRFETGLAESGPGGPSGDAESPRRILSAEGPDLAAADRLLAEAFPGLIHPGEYRQAWDDMARILGILWDPAGRRRRLLEALGFGSLRSRAMIRPGAAQPDRDYHNLGREAWINPADGKISREGSPELLDKARAYAARAREAFDRIAEGGDPLSGWEGVAEGLDHGGMPPGYSPTAPDLI